jgi:peroxiredoxin
VIEAGATAPGFTLTDQDLHRVSLEDLLDKRLVLAFYPADFSPLCSDQLSVYEGVLEEIESRDARLVGISVDGAFCHASGLRHFVWDLGYGFKANEREALTWGALIGGVSLTVLMWIAAYAIGGGR